MPRGFGFGTGMGRAARGFGFGRGYGGNFGPNCRVFPWLPRRWWATGNYQSGITAPFFAGAPVEGEYLQAQAKFLKNQLEAIEKRLEQLGKKEPETRE